MSHARTRRELLARRAPDDRERLTRLLELEQLAIAVYELAIRSGRLDRHADPLARELLSQERSHAAALAAQLGGAVDPGKGPRAGHRPRTPAEVERALAAAGVHVQLARLHTDRDWIRLLARVEGVLEGVYYRAIRHLKAPQLALLAASILANEAQHGMLLIRLHHPHDVFATVPAALVPADAAPN